MGFSHSLVDGSAVAVLAAESAKVDGEMGVRGPRLTLASSASSASIGWLAGVAEAVGVVGCAAAVVVAAGGLLGAAVSVILESSLRLVPNVFNHSREK